MNVSEIPIDDLVREAFKDDPEPEPDEHPSPVDLLAYHTDQLSADDDERIRDHLVRCADCNRILLDLADFPDVELRDERRRRSPAEEADDWRALEARLTDTPRPTVRVAPRVPPAFQAMAAVLAACVLGLLFWVTSLREQLASTSSPRVNVYSKDLQPADTTAVRSSPADVFRIPEGMEHLLFFLNGAGPERFPDYRVDLVDPGGSVVRTRSGLRRAPEGNFTLELPRSLVTEGVYEVRLYGLDGSEEKLVAVYRVEMELD